MSLVGVKPGDCVYIEDRDRQISVYAVERVTKTQVVCNHNARFQLTTGKLYGSSGWHINYGRVLTPEVKQRLHRQNYIRQLRRQLEACRPGKWTTEEVVRVHDDLKKINDRIASDEVLRTKMDTMREESRHG